MEPTSNAYDFENQTGLNLEDELANTPVQRLTSSSIIGDSVENFEGEDLGKIKDLMINLERGCIEYAVLDFGGFLGLGGKLFAIPFNALSLDAERKTFLLNKDKEYLEKAPGFDKDHWPATNSSHFDEVNGYWGDYIAASTGRLPLNI